MQQEKRRCNPLEWQQDPVPRVYNQTKQYLLFLPKAPVVRRLHKIQAADRGVL